MVWYVFVIEAIVFAAIFTTVLFAVYHGDRMYSPEKCLQSLKALHGIGTMERNKMLRML